MKTTNEQLIVNTQTCKQTKKSAESDRLAVDKVLVHADKQTEYSFGSMIADKVSILTGGQTKCKHSITDCKQSVRTSKGADRVRTKISRQSAHM